MIRCMIFDLDGTLVQTEKLKALSYARAVIELCPNEIGEIQVVEAFQQVVGLDRHEVALALIDRFGLEEAARTRMAEFGVSTPWQAFMQVRLKHYEAMLADPQTIRKSVWPHNLALLNEARNRDSFRDIASPEAYERLLLDALNGDASLFTRSDRTELSWSLLDPIITGLSMPGGPTLFTYEPGSWGPAAADEFIEKDGRKWLVGCEDH
jgi:hypothetical protein